MSYVLEDGLRLLNKAKPMYFIMGLKWDDIRGIPQRYEIVELSVDSWDAMLDACINLKKFIVYSVGEVYLSEDVIHQEIVKRANDKVEKEERETLKKLKLKYEGKD